MPAFADSDDEGSASNPQGNQNQDRQEEDSALEKGGPSAKGNGNGVGDKDNGKEDIDRETKNLGFTCCIKQYGVKVKEDDPAKANAGDGYKWQRMFGLFGTLID